MSQDPEDLVPVGFVVNLFSLKGQTAVVTGGAGGLGRAIAIGLAQAGATVVVLDIDEAGAGATADLIRAQGGSGTFRVTDATDSAAVDAAASWVEREVGPADILVNSAGIAFRSPAEDFPEDKFDLVVRVNLKGTFLCCQRFARPMLQAGRGAIVNIASIGSFVAYPYAAAYLASKGGVLQLTRSLALEWRDRGVRVNAIAPGYIETDLTRSAAQQSTHTVEFIKQRMLRPGAGVPSDLVGAAIFLASAASGLVTGHTLACDDGYLIA